MSPTPAIALIGFGEVGQTLAEDLLAVGVTRLSAFDTAFDAPDSLSSRRLSATPGVTRADSHLAAACNADLVISAVTAAPHSTPRSTPQHNIAMFHGSAPRQKVPWHSCRRHRSPRNCTPWSAWRAS